MKNTEKAAIPMSPMPKVVFMPRRLSGNRSKQPRSDPSRESSRPTHPTNRIRGFLRIPYFDAAKRFTPTVVFATHRRCRDSDSIALRTAGAGGWDWRTGEITTNVIKARRRKGTQHARVVGVH